MLKVQQPILSGTSLTLVKNIMTKVDGNTITVGLAKDLEVDNVDVNNNVNC